MADICYEVSRSSHSGRRQRFPMYQTAMMQEEWEKKCKRNKQETLATARKDSSGDSVDVSGESPTTEVSPRYGVSSVCGRRREMEDAVAIHPSFSSSRKNSEYSQHYFGVYDGHGCSHVAARCRERLHKLVQEELNLDEEEEWQKTMERSFTRMDKEVVLQSESIVSGNCKCELQTPGCDSVGSTAVVSIITPDKIVVANCGDSRAVLCRNGKPFPLSTDHKINVVRMCLRGGRRRQGGQEPAVDSISDKACVEASVLLTKLALARHSSDNVSVVVIDLRIK